MFIFMLIALITILVGNYGAIKLPGFLPWKLSSMKWCSFGAFIIAVEWFAVFI